MRAGDDDQVDAWIAATDGHLVTAARYVGLDLPVDVGRPVNLTGVPQASRSGRLRRPLRRPPPPSLPTTLPRGPRSPHRCGNPGTPQPTSWTTPSRPGAAAAPPPVQAARIRELESEVESLRRQLAEADHLVSAQRPDEDDFVELDDAHLLQQVGIYHYHHPLDNAEDYRERVAELREQIKETVKAGLTAGWRVCCLLCGQDSKTNLKYLRKKYSRAHKDCPAYTKRTRKLPEEVARAIMLVARLLPLVPYTDSKTPWLCRCLACGKVLFLNGTSTDGSCSGLGPRSPAGRPLHSRRISRVRAGGLQSQVAPAPVPAGATRDGGAADH